MYDLESLALTFTLETILRFHSFATEGTIKVGRRITMKRFHYITYKYKVNCRSLSLEVKMKCVLRVANHFSLVILVSSF